MKTLLLLRHAKSSWKDEDLDDHDRGLNKRGKSDAPRMGQLLKDENLIPDFILSSSAKRCRKTAEHVTMACGFRGETRFTVELYEAPPDKIRQSLGQTADSFNRVLLVGHNPGLEEFLEQLHVGYTPLTTAALAHLELDLERWSDLSAVSQARLVRLWQPRELA